MKNHFSRLACILLIIAICCPFILTTHADDTTSVETEETSRFHGHFVGYSDTKRTENNTNYSNYSTEELINVILNDQELLLCTLHLDSTGDPYSVATRLSKALVELESRTDADDQLYERYLAATENISVSNDTSKFLSLLLSQPIFIDNLSQQLNQRSMTSTNARGNYISYEGFTYSYTTDGTTYGGLTISLYTASSDYNINEKQVIRMQIADSNPNAVYRAAATSAYNSHSYAWYNQSTSNTYAIFDITNYLNDPHTTRLSGDVSTLQAGDIMVYYNEAGNIIHSAVILSVEDGTPVCISKWGTSGLYEHDFDDVPANYKIDEDFGIVDTDVYRISSHIYRTTSTTAATHTRTCTKCGDVSTGAHTVVNNRCTTCGYTGPFMVGGGILAISEDPKSSVTFSRKQS